MEAWQKTHVAWVTAVGDALRAAGSARQLARSPADVGAMIQSVREAFGALSAMGVPVTPRGSSSGPGLRGLLLVLAWLIVLRHPIAGAGIEPHALAGREEMGRLTREFLDLVGAARMPSYRRLAAL